MSGIKTNETLSNHPKMNVRKPNQVYHNKDHYRFDVGKWNLGKKKVDMKFAQTK